jgi:hypothetical protein
MATGVAHVVSTLWRWEVPGRGEGDGPSHLTTAYPPPGQAD